MNKWITKNIQFYPNKPTQKILLPLITSTKATQQTEDKTLHSKCPAYSYKLLPPLLRIPNYLLRLLPLLSLSFLVLSSTIPHHTTTPKTQERQERKPINRAWAGFLFHFTLPPPPTIHHLFFSLSNSFRCFFSLLSFPVFSLTTIFCTTCLRVGVCGRIAGGDQRKKKWQIWMGRHWIWGPLFWGSTLFSNLSS